MAKIQPSGANDIPTSFRQNRTELNSHNTFGKIGSEFFNFTTPVIEHLGQNDIRYIRTSAALPVWTNISSFSASPITITDQGYASRHTIWTTSSSANRANAGRQNLGVVTVFWLYEPGIELGIQEARQVETDYMYLGRDGVHKGQRYVVSAGSFTPSHNYGVRSTYPDWHHVAFVGSYSATGSPSVSVYYDGVERALGIATTSGINGDIYPNFSYLNRAVVPYVSDVSMFTYYDWANYDLDEFIAKDYARVRDFTLGDPAQLREWFTWRGYSTSLEIIANPDAYP